MPLCYSLKRLVTLKSLLVCYLQLGRVRLITSLNQWDLWMQRACHWRGGKYFVHKWPFISWGLCHLLPYRSEACLHVSHVFKVQKGTSYASQLLFLHSFYFFFYLISFYCSFTVRRMTLFQISLIYNLLTGTLVLLHKLLS